MSRHLCKDGWLIILQRFTCRALDSCVKAMAVQIRRSAARELAELFSAVKGCLLQPVAAKHRKFYSLASNNIYADFVRLLISGQCRKHTERRLFCEVFNFREAERLWPCFIDSKHCCWTAEAHNYDVIQGLCVCSLGNGVFDVALAAQSLCFSLISFPLSRAQT